MKVCQCQILREQSARYIRSNYQALTFVIHDVFVMDICLCGDAYYIVECGAMNGAGFYKANIESIVQHVSAYFIHQ